MVEMQSFEVEVMMEEVVAVEKDASEEEEGELTELEVDDEGFEWLAYQPVPFLSQVAHIHDSFRGPK